MRKQKRTVVHIIGTFIGGLGVSMLVCALIALFYQEEDLFSMLVAGVVTTVIGAVMFLATGKPTAGMGISHKGAFAVVTFGWIAACLVGALPYLFYAHLPKVWFADAPRVAAGADAGKVLTRPTDCDKDKGLGREFCSYTNCVFEATSGFTTTGATIIEAGLWNDPKTRKGGLPHGLLFWRALTHFFGGMGIIVLGVAVLPLLGVGGMQLFKAEVPGPQKDKVAPRVADTALYLWGVYGVMTVAQTILLMFAGDGLFLGLCHSFATMATGGFSPLAVSIETLKDPYSEWVITVFMFLAGANFALHYGLYRNFKAKNFQFLHLRDSEFMFYTAVVAAFSVAVAGVLYFRHSLDIHDSLRAGFFQVTTIITTTGFNSVDFAKWAPGGQLLLFILFFIGGCSGSTSGGPKDVRILLMFKLAFREVRKLLHPHGVMQIRLSGVTVSTGIVGAVAGFVMLYLGIYFISVLIFGLANYDFVTSMTAVGATLGNIGPGLAKVGPWGNYGFFEDGLKWHMTFLMIAGRLELYSLFILLMPEFWRK